MRLYFVCDSVRLMYDVSIRCTALRMHMFGKVPGANGWTWIARYKQKRGA